MQDVNLLPDIEQSDVHAGRQRRFVILLSTVVLIIFGFSMVGLFALYTLSQKKIHDLDVQKTPIENAIQNADVVESNLVAIYAKTSEAQKIISSEPPFRKIVSHLLELQNSGLVYTEIALNPPNKILISGRAQDLPTLDAFLADLTAKDFGRKTFTNIVLQSLSRDDKQSYDFSARFAYTGDQ